MSTSCVFYSETAVFFLLVIVFPPGMSSTANLIRFHLCCLAEHWSKVWKQSNTLPDFCKQLLKKKVEWNGGIFGISKAETAQRFMSKVEQN